MRLYAQATPCYILSPGLPISINVVQGRIIAMESHFATGSKFSSERIGNTCYLKHEGKYVSFVNSAPIVVEDVVTLDDLVYIEPYFNGIFHLRYRYDFINLNIQSLQVESPIKLQWVNLDMSQANFQLDAYMDEYDFLGPYQYEFASVDGFDLLDTTKSFVLIPDGYFNRHLNYDQEEYLINFIVTEYNISIKLMFTERDGNITVYSETFGYLQVAYDEENDEFLPIFSRDYYECPIILEQARHLTTFYLKCGSSYMKLIQRDGVYYSVFTNDRYHASVFQALSDY